MKTIMTTTGALALSLVRNAAESTSLLRTSRLSAIFVGLLVVLSPFAVSDVLAQADTVIYVDGDDGSATPPNFGQDGWGNDAHKFLQDALVDAEFLIVNDEEIDTVEIWVAATDPGNPSGPSNN